MIIGLLHRWQGMTCDNNLGFPLTRQVRKVQFDLCREWTGRHPAVLDRMEIDQEEPVSWGAQGRAQPRPRTGSSPSPNQWEWSTNLGENGNRPIVSTVKTKSDLKLNLRLSIYWTISDDSSYVKYCLCSGIGVTSLSDSMDSSVFLRVSCSIINSVSMVLVPTCGRSVVRGCVSSPGWTFGSLGKSVSNVTHEICQSLEHTHLFKHI